MLEYQADIFENEADSIENFCAGFESIINQYQRNGAQVQIGGCEAYTTSIMKTNGLNWDATQGFEGFLGDGIKKIYEMIKNFFKGIWNFFFGPSKAAQTAKADADEIESILKDGGFKKALDESLENADKSFNIAMDKIRSKSEDLDKLESDLKKDREASKMLDNAVNRIGALFSIKSDKGYDNPGKYQEEMDKFKTTLNELLPGVNTFAAYSNLLSAFNSLGFSAIGTKYNHSRTKAIEELAEKGKVILGNSESALKELERAVDGIRHQAEKEKSRDREYKAQQALRLINIALRRVAHIMTVLAKNLKIIKEQMAIIKSLNVFGHHR